MKDDRARALIIKENSILFIKRNRAGDIYYVLPGGHVENDEHPELTVMREIKEETSLEVKLIKYLDKLVDKDNTVHHIYLCEYLSGTPKLAEDSPELTKESGIDIYTPMWVEITDLKNIAMWPADIKPFLLNYFKSFFDQPR